MAEGTEGTEAVVEPVQEQTREVQYTPEGVMKWLETEEGQKVLQPFNDRAVTKGLQTWQEKNIDKIKDEAKGEIQTEMQKQIDDLSTSLKANKINSEVKLKLLAEGADKEDVDLLMRAVDTSKISVDGDKLIGLTDVINNLKESRPKWFATTKQTSTTGKDTLPPGHQTPGTNGKLTQEQLSKLDSQQRIKYKKENPDWWR